MSFLFLLFAYSSTESYLSEQQTWLHRGWTTLYLSLRLLLMFALLSLDRLQIRSKIELGKSFE